MKTCIQFLVLALVLALVGTGCGTVQKGQRPPGSRAAVVTQGNYSIVGGFVVVAKDGTTRIHPAPAFKIVVNNLTRFPMEVRRDGTTLAIVPAGQSHIVGFACEPQGNQMNLLMLVKDGQEVKRSYSEVLVTSRDEGWLFGSTRVGVGNTLGRQRVMAYTMDQNLSVQRDTAGWW